jgi:bifunctional non-homologous end joining protein LigD
VVGDQLRIELDGFPTALRPMQAVSAEAPFSSDEYLFEVKWDGVRAVISVTPGGVVRIHDRGLNDVTDALPELIPPARKLPPGTILDGELVAINRDGDPDYPLLRKRLQSPRAAPEAGIGFLAFDLLYAAGKPLLRQPLLRRKAQLRKLVGAGPYVHVPDYIRGDGVELFEACLERGLEGVMAKHVDSFYVPGQRSPFWLKVKAVKSDDFVVIGATPGTPFGALLIGFYEQGRLLPCGAIGGGFDDEAAAAIAASLEHLATDESPLSPVPQISSTVRWCRPELVISVRYSEWAPDGTLRFPIFNGLRPEVHPAECVRHRPRVVIGGRARPGTPAYSLTQFAF